MFRVMINERIGIKADSNNFTVFRTGNKEDDILGYYGTLKAAITGAHKYTIKDPKLDIESVDELISLINSSESAIINTIDRIHDYVMNNNTIVDISIPHEDR